MLHTVKDMSHDIPETITRTILQDIKVFAVNDVTGMEEGKKDNSGKSIVAKTISLLVTPDQAAKVTLASQLGTIQLVMRSPDDNKLAESVVARPADLFTDAKSGVREDDEGGGPNNEKSKPGGAAKKAAAAPVVSEEPARPTWNMRVLKGSAVDDVQFEPVDAGADPASASCVWKIVSGGSASPAGDADKESPPAVAPQLPELPVDRPPPARPPESRP
jgi:pilus assembly protein CpaB